MNLFGAVANLGKAVVRTATVPVSVAADCVKGMTDENDKGGRAMRHIKQIGKDVEDAYEDLTDE